MASKRICFVLDVLSNGGWLERHEEKKFPQRPASKLLKGVTRLYDKDGNRLEGVHNYARHRLERTCRITRFKSGQRTIWTLRNYNSDEEV